MPTYTSQKFQNKTRFYLHFFNLCVGLLFSKKKIAFRNLKNSLMLIYTFRFEKLKKMRLLPHRNSLSCLSAHS